MAGPQIDRPPRRSRPQISLSARRDLAIICGVLSIGVVAWTIYGMSEVAEADGTAFSDAWTVLWILLVAVSSMLGAGSVVLWNPPGSRGVVTKAAVGITVVLFLVFGGFFLFGPRV